MTMEHSRWQPRAPRAPFDRSQSPVTLCHRLFALCQGAVMKRLVAVMLAVPLALAAIPPAPRTQEANQDEHGLRYQRRVQFPQGSALPAIVIAEFLTHGELDPRGGNLAVFDGKGNPVP